MLFYVVDSIHFAQIGNNIRCHTSGQQPTNTTPSVNALSGGKALDKPHANKESHIRKSTKRPFRRFDDFFT